MDVKSVRYAANPVLEVFVAKVNQQTSVSLRESSAHRMIQRLDFGGFILLPLEVLNHYAAAVVRKVRKHPQEMGCIREDELLAGDLDYQDFKRLPREDFLRRYSLARLPNDPKLRQRAAEFLRKQGKEDLAREVEVRGQ
jgi:hypothetical protein